MAIGTESFISYNHLAHVIPIQRVNYHVHDHHNEI